MNVTINRLDSFNILAMLLASMLAIVVPFELVLLSYALLGPGHYLTEITWLEGRQFFTIKKYDYLLIILVIGISLLLKLPYANLVYYTFGLSFILLALKGYLNRLLAFIVLVVAGYFLLNHNIIYTVLGLYIPTLIHVYLFTGAFMLLGALRQKQFSGYVAFFVFLLCPVLLCVLFTSWPIHPSVWAVSNYGHFAHLNTVTLRNPAINIYTNTASIILTRLIAFAYTYHYINWFSKTSVINWHHISLTKAIVIGVIWIASIVLYFYNYRLGIRWLFLLSLVHVLLEFPLNQRSFVGIGREVRRQLMGAR
jgi:hypothetical protein